MQTILDQACQQNPVRETQVTIPKITFIKNQIHYSTTVRDEGLILNIQTDFTISTSVAFHTNTKRFHPSFYFFHTEYSKTEIYGAKVRLPVFIFVNICPRRITDKIQILIYILFVLPLSNFEV
jgi:hypothetical protein